MIKTPYFVLNLRKWRRDYELEGEVFDAWYEAHSMQNLCFYVVMVFISAVSGYIVGRGI